MLKSNPEFFQIFGKLRIVKKLNRGIKNMIAGKGLILFV